jgi:hypothetical protein
VPALRALALVVVGLAALVWLVPAAPMTGDGEHYIEFVRNGLQHGASSWHERRLLGPLIVRALPLDAQDGFFVLMIASLAATALLTWLAARDVLKDEWRALVSIALLFGTWVVAPNIREFGLIDPLAWAFAAAAWLFTVQRRWWVVALVAAVGAVAKEVLVLAAVAAAAAAYSRTAPWRPIVVAAPAILVVLALTIVFPGSGADASAYVFKWVRDGLFSNGVPRAAFLWFASYGALWLLVPLGWARLNAEMKRWVAVYLLAALALPLVGSPERMEEVVFPALITLALLATRAHPIAFLWALAVGEALFVSRIGGDAHVPSVVAWAGLAVACAIAIWSYLPLVRGSRVGAHFPDQDFGSVSASG